MPETGYLGRAELIGGLFLLLGVRVADAYQGISKANLDSAVVKGINLTLSESFSEADSLFADLCERFPNRPEGYLYRAALLQARAMTELSTLDVSAFDGLLELATERASLLENDPSTASYAHYLIGTAYGLDGYARALRGDWLGGVKKSSAGASELEAVIAADSTYFDAYAGVGTYYYWKSRKLEFLQWLPFVRDDRALGIRMLEACATSGKYSRFMAMSSLASISLDKQDFSNAERWSREALASYPGNTIFLWMLCSALDGLDRPADAAASYRLLLIHLTAGRSPNPYNEIVCRLNLARAELKAQEIQEAAADIRQLLKLSNIVVPADYAERAKRKFEEANDLLTKLSDGHEPR